jgi:hypothetical protein
MGDFGGNSRSRQRHLSLALEGRHQSVRNEFLQTTFDKFLNREVAITEDFERVTSQTIQSGKGLFDDVWRQLWERK